MNDTKTVTQESIAQAIEDNYYLDGVTARRIAETAGEAIMSVAEQLGPSTVGVLLINLMIPRASACPDWDTDCLIQAEQWFVNAKIARECAVYLVSTFRTFIQLSSQMGSMVGTTCSIVLAWHLTTCLDRMPQPGV